MGFIGTFLLGMFGNEYYNIKKADDIDDRGIAYLDEEDYTLMDIDGSPKHFNKVRGKNKKGKYISGYVKKSQLDLLNVSSIPIPQNFAGLEAVQVPTVLTDQYFDIYEVTENEDYVEVKARHIFYRMLQDSTLWKGNKDTEYTAAACCRNIMTNAVYKPSFRVASDCKDKKSGKDLDYERKNLVEAFLDPEKGICKKFGLSLIRDNDTFYCLKNVGYDRGFLVQNGKNLLGVERTESIENTVTRIAPVGKNAKGEIVWMDHDGKKYIDSEHIDDYPAPRMEIYDTGYQIGKDGVTAENIQAKLLQAAQTRFSEEKVDLPEVKMTIEFLSLGDTEEYAQYRGLDKVYLYDILTIKDTVRGYNYSAQVTGVEHDILTGMLLSVTIGTLDEASESRKIAVWQVPEVNGDNIRLKSIKGGSFEPEAIGEDDIKPESIDYDHLKELTVEKLITDNLEAAKARIHELIAGSITADDIVTNSLVADTIAANAITAEKIAAGAVTADKIAANAITADKIKAGEITADKIAAHSITADEINAESIRAAVLTAGSITAEKIAAHAITADQIDAQSVRAAVLTADTITADMINANSISAINAKLGTANIASAVVASADINVAHIKELSAGSAYLGQAVFEEAVGGKLYIPRLSVGYAQMLGATISDLVIQASNDNYYKLDVDLAGNVTATQMTPTAEEIAQGYTDDGRTIYMGTDILATDLNTQNIYASHGLMDEITANIINVDKLFAREATITQLNAMDLSSNTYIRSTIGTWQSGSTITQTLESIESRISGLGYGTIYYSATEPAHTGLVQGDIWVQPLEDHTWGEYDEDTWQEILDGGTWGSIMGAYKVYTWTGQYWKTLFDSTVNTELWTAIEQTNEQVALKASQTQVDLLSGQVSDFDATLTIQAQQINAAVSAVNAKASSYVMWTDPRTMYTVTLGDIWIKTQGDFGSWLDTRNSTWQELKDNYKWEDALGGESFVWDGTKWVQTADRAEEIYQKTMIDQNARQISLVAESTAELAGEIISVRADLTVANDRISAEVSRSTNAENALNQKTQFLMTSGQIMLQAFTEGLNGTAMGIITKAGISIDGSGKINISALSQDGQNAITKSANIGVDANGKILLSSLVAGAEGSINKAAKLVLDGNKIDISCLNGEAAIRKAASITMDGNTGKILLSAQSFDSLGSESSIYLSPSLIKVNGDKISISTTNFTLTTNGSVTARSLTMTGGSITIKNGGGVDTFKVTSTGKATANDLTINGGAISIKNANNVVTFSVTTVGKLTATDVDITGKVTATSGSFTGAVHASSGEFTGAVHATSGEFNGTVTANGGTIGGFTIASTYLRSGTGSTRIELNTGSGDYAIWCGNNTASSAPFRLKKDGTVALTKLLAIGENNQETEVNLRTAGLWKLNYSTVKQGTITTSGGYCTSFTLSDGTTVNFKSAASVMLSSSWESGDTSATFKVDAVSGGTTYDHMQFGMSYGNIRRVSGTNTYNVPIMAQGAVRMLGAGVVDAQAVYDDGEASVTVTDLGLWSGGIRTIKLSNDVTQDIPMPTTATWSRSYPTATTMQVNCTAGGKTYTNVFQI